MLDQDLVHKALEALHIPPEDPGVRCYEGKPGTGFTCTLSDDHRGPHIAHGSDGGVCDIWEDEDEDEDKVWKAKVLAQFWTINNHAIRMCNRVTVEQVENYIDEAEHGDGYGYWRLFSNGIEVYADIKLTYDQGGP